MDANELADLVRDGRRQMGEWLDQFPWDYFATLTFRYEPSVAVAEDHVQCWVRRLDQRAQRRIKVFWVSERGAAGLLHFHVLLSDVGYLTKPTIKAAWPHGRVDVVAYDRSRRATGYLTKTLWADGLDYDVRL